jgi:small subunit ribosomal protein S2
MDNKTLMQELIERGAHFGFSKSRRHPSMRPFIFTTKNKTDIFDLEKTVARFDTVLALVSQVAKDKKQILFVGTKPEAKIVTRETADSTGNPFVTDRWIGGTLTNWNEIQKRANRLETLRKEQETGELNKYTKKERLGLERLMAKLDRYFGGITIMKEKPAVLVVVDPKKEQIAISEAEQLGIPVIALANSDCDISTLPLSIPANDSSKASIEYFLKKIATEYNAI